MSPPNRRTALLLLTLPLFLLNIALAAPPAATQQPLLRTVDLDQGETVEVKLADGSMATVKLLSVTEKADTVRGAIRQATVEVVINDETITLQSGNYNRPQTIAGVQIDCPITGGYNANNRDRIWAIEKDARLRLWPAGSPLLAKGTFRYPVQQKWFATDTQMANEPAFVNGDEEPGTEKIYYHYGLDIGGSEGDTPVIAATDGLVVSVGEQTLPGYDGTPVRPRYDVVYLLDARGWYYRYSHLHTIDKEIQPGRLVKIGQPIGLLGKEGASGGWSHLHFDITSMQPSGKYGTQEGYAFLWEAYQNEHNPAVIAVARPHHLVWMNEPLELDATRSWSATKGPLRYEWWLSNGERSAQARITQRYDRPGTYSEVLQVTDAKGHVDFDFAVVQVLDRKRPRYEELPPTINATYWPTHGIKTNQPVTFKVRSFRCVGGETWDFGDGSPLVKVKSDGCAKNLAKDGYAVTSHKFKYPGDYIVTVEHTTKNRRTATAHLHVRVGE